MSRLGTAFWRRGQDDVLADFRETYLEALPEMGASGMVWALALTGSMFPKADVDPAYPDRLQSATAGDRIAPVVSQRVLERLDTLRRMLTARAG
jgi:aminopeptidase N